MENLDLNSILDRNNIAKNIEAILKKIVNNDPNTKKGIYIHGDDGIGKTKFVLNLLKKLDYDIIYYDSTNIKNKSIIQNISNNNLSANSVYSLFYEKTRKIVVVIDDIIAMNYGDKNTLTNLIKLIRLKKTKKQKIENYSHTPIICINSNINDKKINELINICNVFEIKNPTKSQLENVLTEIIPTIFYQNNVKNEVLKNNILNFLNNNLHNINKIIFYYKNDLINNFLDTNYNNSITSNYETSIKIITKNLLQKYYNFNNIHLIFECDRTIISLLYHENIINLFENNNIDDYLQILNNFIFCDYIDRIIFQKQIWQLIEMNFIIKIFYNNFLLKHKNLYKNIKNEDIIFTKILTKYSSEYNNYMFLYNLLQYFLNDKKDILLFFINNQNINIDLFINNLLINFENINISKLEIQRIIKFVNQLFNYNIYNENKLTNIKDSYIDDTYYDINIEE